MLNPQVAENQRELGDFEVRQLLAPGILQIAELTYSFADDPPRYAKTAFNCVDQLVAICQLMHG